MIDTDLEPLVYRKEEHIVPHVLNLWRQQLGEVPESVWDRTELQVLILADNGLTELSPGIGRLHRLIELRAQHNQLTALPDSRGDLGSLRELWLRGDALDSLPSTVADLHELRHLDLRWKPCEPPAQLLTELEQRGCVVLL